MSNQVLTIIKPGYTTTMLRPDFLATIPASMQRGSDDLRVILDSSHDMTANRDSSFVVRVSGDAMVSAGIHDGDQLIVDRSLEVQNSSIVIAVIRGSFTVKRVRKENGRTWLMPENDRHHPIEVTKTSGTEIWGVVTNIIHPVL